MELTGVTSSSADAFISNCSSLVYWLFWNGGFCLGAPHKRGFALILSSPSLSLSLSLSLSNSSVPLTLASFSDPRSTTPEVNSPRPSSRWEEAGKVGARGLRPSVLHPLSFSLSVFPSSSFPILPLPPVSRRECVSARSIAARYVPFHYHTIIFCRRS